MPASVYFVEHDASRAIAWVESPLQLIAAAQWAAGQDEPIVVAVRVGSAQMAATADELMARGARFAECIPFYGVPWELLSRHRTWAIGDGFSGQFRAAAAVLRPQNITLLDDGALTISLADALLGRTDFSRPNQRDSALAALLGSRALHRMQRLAARGRLDISTAFDLGADRFAALADRGIRVSTHRLDWIRRTARPIAVPGNRVLLGSAGVTDGLLPIDQYLAWVASEAAIRELAYLPHRRETDELVAAVGEFPGVTVFDTGLPIELVLAGAQEPLEVLTLPSSATTTLAHVLEGTGSNIRQMARTTPRATSADRASS